MMQTANRKRLFGITCHMAHHVARHPAAALIAGVLCAVAAGIFIQGGMTARDRLAVADDPVKISDRALAASFNREIAEREIRAALAADDVDLAQSFVALAAERNVPVDPTLAAAVAEAGKAQGSVTFTAGRFVYGLWTGEPGDLASLAGTAFGDLFVFGDIRDAAREGTRYLTGRRYDPWILGLAGAGLAITALTYTSVGVTMPERVGLSLVKGARRTGRLNPVLAVRAAREAVKVEQAGGLVELAENAGRVEARAGTQAALDTLAIAEEPQDVSRMARLAVAKGGKTRAIVKLLGRAAIVFAASALDVALWMLWVAIAVIGFCSSCKAAVERLTQRAIDKRKLRCALA
ncbi:MAG TPA: hypothetical protein VEI98_12910 [Xanthobacteraceae bacterium]|nr:hypothetical protein [Xanthobacteraceae bacterium]